MVSFPLQFYKPHVIRPVHFFIKSFITGSCSVLSNVVLTLAFILPGKKILFLLEIRCRQRLDVTCSFAEPRPEDAVGILEHAVLERDDDELGALETCLDQATNVLCMRQIQSGINLVQDVHGSGLELEEGHDEGQRHQ